MFVIKFHGIGGLVSPECRTASAAAARRMSADAIRSGAAKRAEICDADGKVLLQLTQDDWMD